MTPQLEVLSTLERRMELALPSAVVASEVDSRLKRLAKRTRVDGFRPGKAPLAVVARLHGAEVHQEVIGGVLQQKFGEAVAEHQLKVAGYPRFEGKPAEGSDEIIFSATFEVYPEVKLGDPAELSIQRPVITIGEAEVDKTLEILRKQRREFVAVERAAQDGDMVKLDFSGTLYGQPFRGGEGKDYTVIVGEGRLLKEFEDNLQGLSAGQEKTFAVTFPEDYQAKELAGKTVSFAVRVTQVSAPQLPAIDADFARALGVEDGDVAKLREEIKGNLQREVRRRVMGRLKEQVMSQLAEKSELELPNSLVGLEIERLADLARNDLASQGMDVKQMKFTADMFEEQAKRRVRLGLILAELIKVHGLTVKPEQVRALVEEAAESYEDPTEVVDWYYAQPSRLQEMESLALEENVVAWVMEKAKVEDVATAFDELMGRT